MRTVILINFAICLMFFSGITAAQTGSSCSAIVERALAAIAEICTSMSRNSACYGNDLTTAAFFSDVEGIAFDQPDDRIELTNVQEILTSPMDIEREEWGIAVLNVQANLPNTLPGQAVTFLLTGNVALENAVPPETAFVDDTTIVIRSLAESSNLRAAPSREAPVIGTVPFNTELVADGRTTDNEWVRVWSGSEPAWINRSIIAPGEGEELIKLPTISSGNRSPMQAFYFSVGQGQPICTEVFPSALMIQGPKNLRINITINNIEIITGSTVLLRLAAERTLQLITLDGNTTTGGIKIPTGFTATRPLSEDLHNPGGPWENLRPLTDDELLILKPLEAIKGGFLHYPIKVPTRTEINEVLAAIANPNATTSNGVISGPAAKYVNCSEFRPTSPLDTMPFQTLPFYWNPAPGATAYSMNIFNRQGVAFSAVVEAPTTFTEVHTPALPGGPEFTWEVTALFNGQVACTTYRVSVVRQQPAGVPEGGGGSYGGMLPTDIFVVRDVSRGQLVQHVLEMASVGGLMLYGSLLAVANLFGRHRNRGRSRED